MQARVLTLRYSATLSGFDDSELQRLAAAHDLLELREHVVSVGGEPCVVLLATWARSEAGTASPPPERGIEKVVAPPAPSRNGARNPVADVLQGLDEAQRAQFERIRAWRAKTAHDEGVPPYVILTNRQLVEVVKQRPDSRTALGRIDGLGDKKLDRYAKALLAQLRPDPTAPTDAGETDTETAQPEEETTS